MLLPPVELFYSYSHRDEELRDELEKHLVLLHRRRVLAGWHDRKISAGDDWKGGIDDHINTANIILLLISADFLASDYCYEIEVQRAMERHESHDARVIPVILRPCDWQQGPFGKLQALPRDARPVTTWANRDEAFLNIAQGIRRSVEQLLDDQTSARKDQPSDITPAAFLESRIQESYRLFQEYQVNVPPPSQLTSQRGGSEFLVEKYREVITYYLMIYSSLCRRQLLPARREMLEIAKNLDVAAQFGGLFPKNASDIYTSLPGSRIIGVGISQMFRIADLLTRPESVKARKLYEAVTSSGKMRRALNTRQSIKIEQLGDLRPVTTITPGYDRFWRPALPDLRSATTSTLAFFPYELSLSPRVQNLRSKFDSVLKAALQSGSSSILNSQIGGLLRIYPPGTGVIQLAITLEFKEAVHVETVAQIARNVEELVFVDAAGLEKPYHELMLEIVERVIESLFKKEGIPYGERRWLPPVTTYTLHDHGFRPENEIEKLSYLLSLAPANEEHLGYLEKRVERAIRLPHWQRDRILAVAGQGAALFFVADLFAKGRRSKRENLQEWLTETHELVSAAAYAQQAFAEEVDRLYSQSLLNAKWLELPEKFEYLKSLLETMRQVMQAIVSIRLHLQKQGTGVLMTLARDIWAYSNPVDAPKFKAGLAYIADWLARSKATCADDRLSALADVVADIQQIRPPFTPSPDYSYAASAPPLQEKLERGLLLQLQEIEQIIRGNKDRKVEQIQERFEVIRQLRDQLGLQSW